MNFSRRNFLTTVLITLFVLAKAGMAVAQPHTTVINARYVLEAVRADGSRGNVEHEFTITLKATGITQQHQTGGLSGPTSRRLEVRLGSDTQSNVRYHVVNGKTIARVMDTPSFISTLTISVADNSCRLNYRSAKKPGREFIEAAAYRGGPMRRFRSFRMIGQHCEIK